MTTTNNEPEMEEIWLYGEHGCQLIRRKRQPMADLPALEPEKSSRPGDMWRILPDGTFRLLGPKYGER